MTLALAARVFRVATRARVRYWHRRRTLTTRYWTLPHRRHRCEETTHQWAASDVLIEPTPRPVYDLGPAPEVEKKKKKRAVNFERMNVTNAHMPELFKAEQVDRLDG